MFFNGFTLLLMIITGLACYKLGRWTGYKDGSQKMYQLCRSIDRTTREFFSGISDKRW